MARPETRFGGQPTRQNHIFSERPVTRQRPYSKTPHKQRSSQTCSKGKKTQHMQPLKHSNTYPPNTSLSKDDDIEQDYITPTATRTSVSENRPTSVPSNSTFDQNNILRQIFPWLGKKGTISVVFMKHEHATDSVNGDRFGFDIYTNEPSKAKEYFRHFVVKLVPDSPADKMKVQNGEELVMVNDTFAPELNHQQIMDLFSRIPVDGVTRFTMILRRKVPTNRSSTSKKWQWFETSAILIPELDKEPVTKKLHYKPIENNMIDNITSHMYKVIGQQDYLTLSQDGVGVDTLNGDKIKDRNKIIWKHAIVREKDPDGTTLVYEASLSCADRKYFATIHCNNVTVVEEEVFFQYRSMGSEIYFKQGNSYLNCRNRTVGASTDEQFFEEFGSPGHRDVVDDCYTSACYTTLYSRRITRSMSRQLSYKTQFGHTSV